MLYDPCILIFTVTYIMHTTYFPHGRSPKSLFRDGIVGYQISVLSTCFV